MLENKNRESLDMKRVCILTVYNSENAGSFLQAYALQEAIKKQGYPVCFLKRDVRGTSHDKIALIKSILKSLIKLNIKRATSIWTRHFSFSKFQRRFEVVERCSPAEQIGLLIVGSDTLWYFESNYFWRKRQHYLAQNIRDVDKITYAISADGTSYKRFSAVEGIKEALNAFKALGVRDHPTDKLIKQVSMQDTQLVCDPTFLLDHDEYSSIIGHFKKPPFKYLLLYHFGQVSKDLQIHLEAFAKAHSLQIINLGLHGSQNWFKTVVSSPDSFLQYMKHADYVLTNTFHGTVFSIIFRKNFVSFTRDKKKVIDLLHQLSMQDRLLGNAEDVQAAFEKGVDYQSCTHILNSIIDSSKEFLAKQLESSCAI